VIKHLFQNSLIELIQGENKYELKRMFIFSALVGLAASLIIVVLNQAASLVLEKENLFYEFIAFIFLLAFFLYFYQKNNHESISSTQKIVYRIRLEIISLVLRSDLSTFNSISKDEISTAINRDSQMISQSIVQLVGLTQGIAIIFFSLIYLATLSWMATLLILIFIVGTVSIFVGFHFRISPILRSAWKEDLNTFEYVSQFLSGYQEIKMSSQKAKGFIDDLIISAKKSRNTRKQSQILIGSITSYIQITFYVAVGTLIFVVPTFSEDFSNVVQKVATTSLFIVGSLQGVIASLPVLIQAETAATQLINLKNRLEDLRHKGLAPRPLDQYPAVHCIQLHQIQYDYPLSANNPVFDIGPISYRFESGKTYFIRGQNGSGKTTFIRVLLGLYQPSKGYITVDDQLVEQPTNGAYRDLFSVVFSDFYLFKKLYGISKERLEDSQALIDIFQLEGKLSILDDQFGTINLSTGQRKRLGLIEALLEDKQFVVLDEWAADQDPEFRKYFYQVLIPYIKGLGKTLIAISHDDKYFDVADEIITINQGKLA